MPFGVRISTTKRKSGGAFDEQGLVAAPKLYPSGAPRPQPSRGRRADALLRLTPTPSGPQLYYTHCAVPNASAYVGFVCGPAASLLRCIVLLSSANYIA